MESATPNLHEQGVQALREGNLDGAIDLLARAVMADGQDTEAQAFLGVAYSQKGLHAEAKRALESAVALRPQEVRYRFNLGVALEQASDWNGAANAYRHALQINPEYAQARAKLQALSGKIQPSPSAGAPPVEAASRPLNQQAPWLAGTSAPGAAPQGGPPGTVQCSQCRQWSKPGLSCEWCSAPLKSAPAPRTGPYLEPAGGSVRYQPERPVGITVLVVLSYIGAVFFIIGGLLMFIGLGVGMGAAGMGGAGMGRAGTGAVPGMMAVGAVAMGIAAFLIVYAIGIMIIGAFLWKGYNWARITYIVLQALGIVMSGLQLLQGKNPLLSLIQVLVSVLFLVILTGRAARDFCVS